MKNHIGTHELTTAESRILDGMAERAQRPIPASTLPAGAPQGVTWPLGGAHAPLPWAVDGHPGGNSGTSFRAIKSLGAEFSPAYIGEALDVDAAMIVRAVNSHAQLVAALRETLRVLVTSRGLPGKGKGRTPEQQTALDAARAALAAATESEAAQ